MSWAFPAFGKAQADSQALRPATNACFCGKSGKSARKSHPGVIGWMSEPSVSPGQGQRVPSFNVFLPLPCLSSIWPKTSSITEKEKKNSQVLRAVLVMGMALVSSKRGRMTLFYCQLGRGFSCLWALTWTCRRAIDFLWVSKEQTRTKTPQTRSGNAFPWHVC